MARTKTVTKTSKFGFRKVPRRFGKGYKSKFGIISSEKKSVKTKVPRKISSEQIVSSMNSDARKLEGVKAIEKARSTRTALLTTGANVSQTIGSVASNEYAKNSPRSSDLSQLVSGGISQTGTSRDDDDDDGSPEVM